MISGALPRGLAVLECLAANPAGLSLGELSEGVSIPKAAIFRALSDLIDAGYARQDPSSSTYMLSIKFPAIALRYLSMIDSVQLAKPFLKRLADQSKEHVRLALVEGNVLVFVAHEEGSKSALRFTTESGTEPSLYYTATGLAWLSGFDDQKALELVMNQGIGSRDDHGPNAPQSIGEFLERLSRARQDGYSLVEESNEVGVSGIAVPVHSNRHDGQIACVLTVVGPSPRLSQERMKLLLPLLNEVAEELGALLPGNSIETKE